MKFTYDLLREADPRPSVIGRTDVPVAHYVLASETTIRKIKDHGEQIVRRVYSHPQVWTQCTKYLFEHFVDAEKIDRDSTALAAQQAATEDNAIAIASSAAADVIDVEVYETNVQDVEGNYTRFLVLEPYVDGQKRTELDRWVAEEIEK